MNFDSFGIDGTVSQTMRTSNTLNKMISPNEIESNGRIIPNGFESAPKPAILQLVLPNGQAIAEYIVDDIDNLMGKKSKIQGRKLGYA